MRRSGVKDLTRRGLSLGRIQYYGRWGPTIIVYVEEALGESSELRGIEASWDDIQVELAKLLREAQRDGSLKGGSAQAGPSMSGLLQAARPQASQADSRYLRS